MGAWNRGRILVLPDGKTVHCITWWKVVENQRGTQYFYALVARSKYAQWTGFEMAPRGISFYRNMARMFLSEV